MSQKRVAKSKRPTRKKKSKTVTLVNPSRLSTTKFHKTIREFLVYMEDRWFMAGRFNILQMSAKMVTLEPRYKDTDVKSIKNITSDALRLHGIPKAKVIFDSKKNVIKIFGTE